MMESKDGRKAEEQSQVSRTGKSGPHAVGNEVTKTLWDNEVMLFFLRTRTSEDRPRELAPRGRVEVSKNRRTLRRGHCPGEEFLSRKTIRS